MRAALGQTLGRVVRDEMGRVLLSPGARLTPGLCEVLARRGYSRVYVQDGIADDVGPREALTEQTRTLAHGVAVECFRQIGRGDALPLETVVSTVDAILRDLARARDVVLEFATLRSASDYTYVHSVNVCVYSLLVAQALAVSGQELRALGVGALLHDVGKVLCADLCSKPGALSEADWTRIRQHPIDGFEMLRQHHDLHLFAAHIAYQHHERLDGSGYPRGLRAERILPVARIVAAADVYDAMTSDRPYAPARSTLEALAVLREGAGRLFDADVVRAFVQRLAVYPSGTPVLLADSSVGVVVGQGSHPDAPRVRVLGRAGTTFPGDCEVEATGVQAVGSVLQNWPPWLIAGPPRRNDSDDPSPSAPEPVGARGRAPRGPVPTPIPPEPHGP